MADDRYYKKGNPENELYEVVANNQTNATPFKGIPVSAQNYAYTKPEATILPKAYIVVFSGGTVREKDYFRLITRNPSLYTKIKIDFWANDNFEQGGKPEVITFAIDKTHNYQESANEDNPDSYFLITDVDHFGDFLPEMKKECDENDIELIVSNSCFEVWLYYAEKEDRCAGFEIPTDKNKISSSFKTWANNQIKGGLKPTKALLEIEKNIENARANYSEEDGFPTLFSTQMFILAEKMLPYVKEVNEKIIMKYNVKSKK